MTKDEALKLALEALENIDRWLPTIGQKGLRDYEADAITAIKEALAQDEPWTPDDMAYRPGGLSQPAQEPEPDELAIAYMSGLYDGKKQRPWVGLKDDDLVACSEAQKATVVYFMNKLKEKNT